MVTVYCESSGCPVPELIKPCVCEYKTFEGNGIRCGGHSDIDLVNIFQTLEKNLKKSEKHLSWFELNNIAINKLQDNTFADITFDGIDINNCNNLTYIDRYVCIERCEYLTFPQYQKTHDIVFT